MFLDRGNTGEEYEWVYGDEISKNGDYNVRKKEVRGLFNRSS